MNTKLIFDIGMHHGEDTVHYLKKGYRVVAVEANPFLAKANTQKFDKYIQDGSLTIQNLGIADQEGVVNFYINEKLTEWSSFNKALGSRYNTPFTTVEISCVRMHSLFEKFGIPFYLKTDIEGHDLFCIQDIPGEAQGPNFVSSELSHIDIIHVLYKKGYRQFKLINQSDAYRPMVIQKELSRLYQTQRLVLNGLKLRAQKLLPFRHLYGSSGPFGNNTKGPWLSYATALDLYKRFYEKGEKAPNSQSWFDVHATF